MMSRAEAEAKYRLSPNGQAKAVEAALKGKPWRPAIVECSVCHGWDNRMAMEKLDGKYGHEWICGPCLTTRVHSVQSEPSDTFFADDQILLMDE